MSRRTCFGPRFGRIALAAVASAGIFALSACATAPIEADISDVQTAVSEHLARGAPSLAQLRLHWNQGSAEDEEVAGDVLAMLKAEVSAPAAVQIALLNNRNLQAIYEELGIAQAALVQAGLLKNPIFHAGIQHSIGGVGPEVDVSIAGDFLDIFYRPLRRRVAEADFEAAKFRVSAAVIDLASRTRARYFTLQAGEQAVQMLRQTTEATAASLEVTQRLYDAGNITQLDLINEQALDARARLDLGSAEAGAREDRERLAALMGLWGEDSAFTIPFRLPDLPEDPLDGAAIETRAVEQSLDLAVARAEIDSAGQALGLTRASALLPTLEVEIVGTREAEDNDLIGPGITLPIPFFDQGQARIATARSELRRRQERYYALAVEVRSAARVSWDRLQSARSRAIYHRDFVVPLHVRIVEQTQLQYNAMQIGPQRLLLAKQNEIEAGLNYIESLRGYWLARVRLERILSGRLSGEDNLNELSSSVQSRTSDNENQGGQSS